MFAYNYDRFTKEYTGTEKVFLDNEATIKEGKEVYLMPAFSTSVEPFKLTKPNTIQVWNGYKWEEKEDYRGKIIYNVETRQPKVWGELGPIPADYVFELKPSLTEMKVQYLAVVRNSFLNCINNVKITIPNIDLTFTYSSLENIKNEKELGLIVSRDDNDKIYSNLTREQYDDIINYLTVYGQLVYLQKWSMENSIKKCNNIELLEKIEDKLNIKIDLSQVKNLVKMPEDKRNDYYVRTAKNIK